jgi:hypothetical protein
MAEDASHKPPVFIDGLRTNNEEAMEVLMRKTNSKCRKKGRIARFWRNKYEENWEKYSDLQTHKFQQELDHLRQSKPSRSDYYDYLLGPRTKNLDV